MGTGFCVSQVLGVLSDDDVPGSARPPRHRKILRRDVLRLYLSRMQGDSYCLPANLNGASTVGTNTESLVAQLAIKDSAATTKTLDHRAPPDAKSFNGAQSIQAYIGRCVVGRETGSCTYENSKHNPSRRLSSEGNGFKRLLVEPMPKVIGVVNVVIQHR